MQLRAWLVLTVVIATVQAVLALLATLQHDALFSSLVRQRLAVYAQATAQAFQPIVELGLPLAMMRNGDAIASRPIEIDPTIEAVDVFAPTGTVLYSSRADPPEAVSDELLVAMRLAADPAWSIETTGELDSGYTVLATDGRPVGAVVVRYLKDGLHVASSAMRWRTATQALANGDTGAGDHRRLRGGRLAAALDRSRRPSASTPPSRELVCRPTTRAGHAGTRPICHGDA